MKRLISFTTVLEVVLLLLLLVRVASPAEPPGLEITIDGKPIQGRARIEITTDKPDPGAASPTGREPRILWSRQWQARWQRAAAENHPWHQWLQFAVANAGSAYFDKELFPTLLYQLTGDPAHARQAYQNLQQRFGALPSQDIIRAKWLTWLICWEWLYPALAAPERAELDAFLDRCAQAVALTPLADSDRLVTAWFGLAIWSALGSDTAKTITATEHYAAMGERLVEYARLSEGGEWVEGTSYNSGTATTLMLGLRACEDLLGQEIDVPAELSALPAQFAQTERHRWDNTLSHRLTWGAIQTANYPRRGINRGDLVLDLWAAAGLHDLVARAQPKGGYWAKPHGVFYLFADPMTTTTTKTHHGGTEDTEPARELRGDAASHKTTPLSVLRASVVNPLYHVVPGQQMLYARSSWSDSEATCVLFRCGRHNGFAHHPTFDGGHFEMLRKGEWVLTRPRAYSDSGNVDGAGANNSLLLGNQPINFARREMLGAGEVRSDPIHRVGQDPINGVTTYWLMQEHGGPWQHGNNRTAEYVHSAKRWLVWVRSDPIPLDVSSRSTVRGALRLSTGGLEALDRHGVEDRINPVTTSDVLLIRDVLNVSQPPDQRADRKAYNIGKAAERHAEYIASQAADERGSGGAGEGGRIPLVQWIIHAPVKPRKGGAGEGLGQEGGIEWSTPGGQQVRVTTLLPAAVDVTLLDEANHYQGVDAKELGWQVRISPAGFQGGQVELLHAVVVWDPPAGQAGDDRGATGPPSVTREQDGSVLVKQPGHKDARVSFSDKEVQVR